jgi:hypothetical protein
MYRQPGDHVIRRDLAQHAPPLVDNEWIAACFTPNDARTLAMHASLAPSVAINAQLETAEVLVIHTPRKYLLLAHGASDFYRESQRNPRANPAADWSNRANKFRCQHESIHRLNAIGVLPDGVIQF